MSNFESDLEEIRAVHIKTAEFLDSCGWSYSTAHNHRGELIRMVEELQAQIEGWRATRDHLQLDVKKLQAQVVKLENENRKLLDPSGVLLPPIAAIKEKGDGI